MLPCTSAPLVRPGEFIVRINLTFNFPRDAYPDAFPAIRRDAPRRSRAVKRRASKLFARDFRRRRFVYRCTFLPCRITGIIGRNCRGHRPNLTPAGRSRTGRFRLLEFSSSNVLSLISTIASILFSSAGIIYEQSFSAPRILHTTRRCTRINGKVLSFRKCVN